jgi:hypothetical protein
VLYSGKERPQVFVTFQKTVSRKCIPRVPVKQNFAWTTCTVWRMGKGWRVPPWQPAPATATTDHATWRSGSPVRPVHSSSPAFTSLPSIQVIRESVLGIRIRRIRMFWASRIRWSQVRFRIRILPSSSKNSKKNLDFYCFVTSL